jgi:ATP-dependent Clp protease adaptor protein ClpS
MGISYDVNPATQQDTAVMEQEEDILKIVLFNDEVNSFDWVISSLVAVCEHSAEQAEQCAVLTHYKGKCVVKSGSYADLEPRCTSLLERGLSVEIM